MLTLHISNPRSRSNTQDPDPTLHISNPDELILMSHHWHHLQDLERIATVSLGLNLMFISIAFHLRFAKICSFPPSYVQICLVLFKIYPYLFQHTSDIQICFVFFFFSFKHASSLQRSSQIQFYSTICVKRIFMSLSLFPLHILSKTPLQLMIFNKYYLLFEAYTYTYCCDICTFQKPYKTP